MPPGSIEWSSASWARWCASMRAASPLCSTTARSCLSSWPQPWRSPSCSMSEPRRDFLPLDDTGLIYGGTQASTEVSFQAMYDLQQKAEAVVRANPAVADVGSSIGTTGWNGSGNLVHQSQAAGRT